MASYMGSFGQDLCCYSVTQDPEDASSVSIDISAQNSKLDNFWSGEWLSSWQVSGGVLSGSLKIRCHYFEMGNLAFNLDKDFDSVTCKDVTSADAIVNSIKATEDKVSRQVTDKR